ncbi:MAG TPA: 4Fe-4S single cluster domain-containing protein [Verrucomicrobiales bacterium]|nr:4Fe-4S single cluster domain-containing protein [Verrucomicrobiales bacterium]
MTTLGPGRRAGIWFQGCSLHCPGCISADTWAHGQGETTVAEVMKTLSPWLAEADGVTISGGEPFEQVEALKALLIALRKEIGGSRDVLVYSGQPWGKISLRVSAWPGLADALISDPFLRSASQTLVWRGSDNQRLHLLTELGRERYSAWLHVLRETLPKALDVCYEGDTIWMAGIPDAGSLALIRRALAEAGFSSSASDMEQGPTLSFPVFA